MLIRIYGGIEGISDYLATGRKQGREETRHELDERVVLDGDLEFTDRVIDTMPGQGERYLHVSLSFREDHVPIDVMREISAEFKEFAFAAYQPDELDFYAEAHLPRIKSYVHRRTGELIERKPHIHVVIPKHNLLSGHHANPFGLVARQTKWLDAFQEHINNKYGLESPKDHRREFNDASEMISRYKGDLFPGANRELKQRLLAEIFRRNITRYEDFKAMLTEHGLTRTRNAGRANEYENIKPPDFQKGVNLKDFVFSRDFIELSDHDKRHRLAQVVLKPYETPRGARSGSPAIEEALHEWKEVRAREIRYINSGNRALYQRYRTAHPDGRRKILDERERRFNDECRSPQERIVTDLTISSILENLHPGAYAVDTPGESSREMANNYFQDQPPAATIGNCSSVIAQYQADFEERCLQRSAERNSEFGEIKLRLDARRLLLHVSKTHGVIAQKYRVTKGKDGGDRIQCGSRNLNVADFLTKEVHLPFVDAAPILRECYAAQLARAPGEAGSVRRTALWRKFQEWKSARQSAYEKAWDEQKGSERERNRIIKEQFYTERTAIREDSRLRATDRKSALSLVRMQKVSKEKALRDLIRDERDVLRGGYHKRHLELYRNFLMECVKHGDEDALSELRRMRMDANDEPENTDRLTSGADHFAYEVRAPLIPAITYIVSRNGDVTYQLDGRAALVDAAREVRMLRHENAAVEFGLGLAIQKFGRRLAVNGTDAFKRQVVEVAVSSGIQVEFAEAALNTYKEQLRTWRAGEARLAKLGRAYIEQHRPAAAVVQTGERKHKATLADERASYTGKIIDLDDLHIYQGVGAKVVAHKLTKFTRVPHIGENLHIRYDHGSLQVTNVRHDRGRDF